VLFRRIDDKILKLFNRRIGIFFSILLFFFSLLILRLIYLQIVSYEKLKTLSDNNRIRIVRVLQTEG